MKFFGTLLASLTLLVGMALASPSEGVKPCSKETLATLPTVLCSLGVEGAQVNYYFPAGFVAISQRGLPSVVVPSDIRVLPDPKGAYTFLISSPKFDLLTAGQSLTVTLDFYVSGASTLNAWAHDCATTGDGVVETSQAVRQKDDDVWATATCDANNTDPSPMAGAHFLQYGFLGFTPTRVVISLDGGKRGTASLHSLGTHYNP